jgi:hypothetical protein
MIRLKLVARMKSFLNAPPGSLPMRLLDLSNTCWWCGQVPKDYVNCCDVYKKGAVIVKAEIYVCLIIYTELMQKINLRPLNAAHESVLDEAWNGCGEG